jgi:hypothetical protein
LDFAIIALNLEEVVTSEQIGNAIRLENKWVHYYEALCTRCNKKFEIEEREGYYNFWAWKINN